MRNSFVSLLGIGLVLTASAVAQEQRQRVLAQIGSGTIGSTVFRTLIRLSNEQPSVSSGRIVFVADRGTSLAVAPTFRWSVEQSSPTGVPEGGVAKVSGNRVEFQIPSGHSLEITLAPGSEVQVGHAVLEDDGLLVEQTLLQFGRADAGESSFGRGLIREVENHAVEPSTGFSVPVEPALTDGVSSAFAIANLSAAEVDVDIRMRPDAVVRRSIGRHGMLVGFWRDILGIVPAASSSEESPHLQILDIRSAAPLGLLALRTLGGIPLSGVAPAPIPADPGPAVRVGPGQEFQLAVGGVALIEEAELAVRFWNLVEDSRCPVDALILCASEGQAVIQLSLTLRGEKIGDVDLTTRGGSSDQKTIRGHVVELLELTPPAKLDPPLRIGDFRARLRVSPAPETQTQLGAEFELAVGRSAAIEAEKLEVVFRSVTEDSRCPTGVVCVWEGQAAIEVRLVQDGRELGDLRLVSRAGAPDRRSLGGYDVELLEVSPYPDIEQGPIKIEAYRAKLRVAKSQ